MNTFSWPETETRAESLARAAARLMECGSATLELISGGRNSQVYRATGADGRRGALKVYFRHAADRRDRLAAEFDGLSFLWASGLRGIPQPLAADREAACALYEYIDGARVAAGNITRSEIEVALGFLARLQDLNGRADARSLPPASEACFSGLALLATLRRRLERLTVHGEAGDSALRAFLADEFEPAFASIAAWSRDRVGYEHELSWNERTLSPSDFGFHNALRQPDGRIVFVDFEYFGWDDPAKLAADFLLHPAMELPADLKRQYAAGMLALFGERGRFRQRMEAFYPLFGLKWCLILLNEFLPEELSRRRFASVFAGGPEAAQREQLSKARRMLRRIAGEYEHFAYFS